MLCKLLDLLTNLGSVRYHAFCAVQGSAGQLAGYRVGTK